MKKIFVFLSGFVFLLSPFIAYGSQFIINSSAENVNVGDEFKITLRLNPQNHSVNALQGKIIIADNLRVLSLNDGDSLVGLWIEKPAIKGDAISFSGIMPNGYNGDLSPFWNGFRPGKVFEIIIRANQSGSADLTVSNPLVLLNDGKGTRDSVSSNILNISVATSGTGAPQKIIVDKDTSPPEPFTPQIARDHNTFDNKWFLIFKTRDNETGVHHYEVKESPQKWDWWGLLLTSNEWRTTESPYLLKDQRLKSFIYVKAVDGAGNEKIAQLPPKFNLSWYENYLNWLIIIIITGSLAKILWKRKVVH